MALPHIHSLWIGETLSPLEQLTAASFIYHGHTFHLWVYDEVKNVPRGVVIKDAATVLPRTEIFQYKSAGSFGLGKNSFAGFSDLFRYKLLHLYGECWVDMDITCLKPLDIDEPYLFRRHHKLQAVGNVLCSPAAAPLMEWCYIEMQKRLDPGKTDWMLPVNILNEGIKRFELGSFIKNISNRDSFPILQKLLRSDTEIPREWKVIHWMNEEFRRIEIPKDKFIKGSTIQQLMMKHEISHEIIRGSDLSYRLKTSTPYYAAINLPYWRSWVKASST